MTHDDIIRMAREAGMERVVDVHKDGTRTIELPHPDLLKRFAALVAAAEREACATILDCNAEACNNNSMLRDVLMGNALAIRARSKE